MSELNLKVGDQAVEFLSGDRLLGRYEYRDAFKPYLHPLCTPAGHVVSLAMPHDHKHHKGVMYALCTAEVNYWEESPTRPDELVGVQQHETFGAVVASGPEIGFSQILRWSATGGRAVDFHEIRHVYCRRSEKGDAYAWRWETQLKAARSLRLVQSPWSRELPDGRKINYHGLGVRFRREFGVTGGSVLEVDGRSVGFGEAMGMRPRVVRLTGCLDGFHPVRRAYVQLTQPARPHHALFPLETPFAFLAVGPSNEAVVTLEAGTAINERFVLQVGDIS
jgi:hypothetical protein